MHPVVSVIITSYNRERFIRQAIDSVLNQKCSFPYEIIVGDDFSTDGTRDILLSYKENYPELFVLNFQDQNVGIGRNWASTVKLAKGRYLALDDDDDDDDDWWHDCDKLQKQIDYLEANPEVGVLDTDYRTYDESTGEYREVFNLFSEYVDVKQGLFSGKYTMFPSVVMLRKDVFDKIVNLDDYVRLNFPLQDWSTFMLLSGHTKFAHLHRLRRHIGLG